MATTSVEDRLIRYEADVSKALASLDKLQATADRAADGVSRIDKQFGVLNASMGKLRSGVNDFVGGFVAAFTARAVVGGIRGIIDGLDDAYKASQKLGLSVEDFTRWQHAADMSGVSAEGFSNATKRMAANMADISKGSTDAAKALQQLGVNVTDTTDQALTKLADRFSKMEDGPRKTALAMDIFGKAGADLLPMLNAGAAGIQDLKDEADRLGITMSTDAAKAAEKFNDRVSVMQKQVGGLALDLAEGMLPALLDIVGAFEDTTEKGNGARTMGENLGNMFKWVTEIAIGTAEFVQKIGINIAALAAAAAAAADFNWAGVKAVWEARGEDLVRITASSAARIKKLYEGAVAPAAKDPTRREPPPEPPSRPPGGGGGSGRDADPWGQWVKSLESAMKTAELVKPKIDFLKNAIANLDLSTVKGTIALEVYQKALDGLEKGAGVEADRALRSIAEQAEKLAESPYVIKRLTDRLEELALRGQGAGIEAELLRDKILALRAGIDAAGEVAQAIKKIGDEAVRAANLQEELIQALARGDINADQMRQLAEKFGLVSKAIDDSKNKAEDFAKAFNDVVAKNLGDISNNLIDGFGKTGTSWSDMLEGMLKDIAKFMASRVMKDFLDAMAGKNTGSGGGANAGGGFWAAIISAIGGIFGSAHGNVFARSPGLAAYENQIVSQPTLFKFAQGARFGVFGEAGAEAVVPLRRGSGGDLGVGAAPVVINIANNAAADTEVKASERTGPNAERIIELEVRKIIKQSMSDGSMDRTMRSNFGLSRSPSMG